jgi:hypothetical protein
LKFFLKSWRTARRSEISTAENLFNRFQGKERRSGGRNLRRINRRINSRKENFDTPQKVIALYDMSLDDLQKKYPNIVSFVTASRRNAP